MKKVSKLVSVILTMAMLCTAVVFTQMTTVSAAEGEYLLNLDFNSGDINKAGDEAEFTVTSDGGSDDGYLSVKKTTWNGSGYEFTPATDESFQVEFDFNFDTNNVDSRYIMLNPAATARTADKGVLLLSTRSDGQMYFGAKETNLIGEFDINTWYTYKAYINSNTGYCAVDVCKRADGSYVGGYNGILAAKTEATPYDGIPLNTEFGMFSFLGNTHTATKLDNIKITDSDAYAFRADFKTFPTTTGEAATVSTLSETNGNTYAHFVKSTWNGTGYSYPANSDETFEIEFDFNFDTAAVGNRYFMLNPGASDRTATNGLLLLATGSDSNIYFACENGTKKRPIGTISDNTWYTYKAYINADTGYCIVNVYERESGNCIGGYNGTVDEKGTNAYTGIVLGKDYGMFSLLGNAHTGTSLDNIVISDAEEKQEYILYADYDNYSTAVETDGTGAGIITEDGNKVFSTDNTAAWKQSKHNFKTISSGRIQVKFDVKTDKGGCWYVMLGPSSGLTDTKWLTLLAMNSYGVINFAGLDVSKDYPLGEMTPNTWYSYDAIIDIETAYCDVKVTRKDDGAKVGSFAGVVATSTSAYKGFPVAGTTFGRLTINGELVGAKLDNFSIAEYIVPPAAPTSSNVTIKDVAGTVQTDALAVSPLTKTVEIDFGVEMDTTTISNDTVFVSTKGGTTALEGSSVSASGTKATITLPALALTTEYTLNVTTGAASTKGMTLDANAAYDLKTTAGEASFTITNTNPGTYAALKGTEITIPCSYVNSTLAPKSVQFIIAYYDANNMLVAAEVADASFTAEQTSGTYEFKHTILDVTGATNAKVMAWESFDTLRPLSLCATLN